MDEPEIEKGIPVPQPGVGSFGYTEMNRELCGRMVPGDSVLLPRTRADSFRKYLRLTGIQSVARKIDVSLTRVWRLS